MVVFLSVKEAQTASFSIMPMMGLAQVWPIVDFFLLTHAQVVKLANETAHCLTLVRQRRTSTQSTSKFDLRFKFKKC